MNSTTHSDHIRKAPVTRGEQICRTSFDSRISKVRRIEMDVLAESESAYSQWWRTTRMLTIVAVFAAWAFPIIQCWLWGAFVVGMAIVAACQYRKWRELKRDVDDLLGVMSAAESLDEGQVGN